jgi:hypothetical protein
LIFLIDNSSMPFTEARTKSLGVRHKAVMVTSDEGEPSQPLAVATRDARNRRFWQISLQLLID